MKKSMFALAALALGLFACQKQQHETPEPPGQPQDTRMYPVRINLAGFLQKVEELPANARATGMSARDTALGYKVSHLYYIVYNSQNFNTTVRQWHQTPATSGNNFGLISDSLPQGNYVVTLLASRQPLTFSDTAFGNRAAYIPVYGDTVAAPQEIFRARLDLHHPDTLGGGYHEVTLGRVISQVQVNVNDAPYISGYANISVKIRQAANGFYISTAKGWRSASQLYVPASQVNSTTFTAETFPSVQGMPYQVEILARHKMTGDTVAIKTVNGIVFDPNRKISLVGNLLPASPNEPVGFGVSLNQVWLPLQVIQY